MTEVDLAFWTGVAIGCAGSLLGFVASISWCAR